MVVTRKQIHARRVSPLQGHCVGQCVADRNMLKQHAYVGQCVADKLS